VAPVHLGNVGTFLEALRDNPGFLLGRNLRAHKVAGDRDCASKPSLSASVFPRPKPIEMPYSKFKTFLRKVAARIVPVLRRAIHSFILRLGPREFANYFRHPGYVSHGRNPL
jgi:hypothetical protein